MEKILLLAEQTTETIPETIPQTMTEIQMLEQINNNLVTIGNVQNLILGALTIIIIYGMYKAVVKFFGIFF